MIRLVVAVGFLAVFAFAAIVITTKILTWREKQLNKNKQKPDNNGTDIK